MKFEISQRFFFEAAHTLERVVDTAASRRVHGHTYQAEVRVSAAPDPVTGMVLDLGLLRRRIAVLHERLDHVLLNEVAGLGPPTLENLCAYIARELHDMRPPLSAVRVWREASGDACLLSLDGPR